MVDIAHAGTVMTLQADVTFSDAPIPITYSPQDTDPFDAAAITIGDAMMGTNGNVITWSTAVMTEFTIAVIPKSPDHKALATLLNANVVAPGQTPNGDKITLSRVMPDGTALIIKNVTITGGKPYMSLASAGNIKTPTYTFKAPPVAELIISQL